ncbi:MAG: DNA replication/repair protein RecF [Hyphomicrobiales bacterium]|nr:MAG: DNA replication/repair protein RecF [Hyphomicrobiales bacterium]
MWIEELKLHQFRNFTSLRLPLDERHVVLSGENGAGKTNLLEAVSFLSPGRGLRRATYAQVTKADAADTVKGDVAWAVHTELNGAAGPVSIGTGLQPGGQDLQRKVHVNSALTKSTDGLLEHARVLWLTPAMDNLFTGPASDRRRFLDRLVLAIDPTHGKRVNDFERAMRSRNKLLEDRQSDPSWLDGLEIQLAETGVAIVFARAELVALLQGIIEKARSSGDDIFPHAEIILEGTLETMIREGAASDLEDTYRATLCRERPRDRAAGRTLDGPHRCNLAVRHGPKNMEAAICSTGEQKALLTGLILAHAQLVGDVSGMAPILLLDEIAAHLDPSRRAALFDKIDEIGCQAWMTGTDDHLFEALGDRAQHFIVSHGSVSPNKFLGKS